MRSKNNKQRSAYWKGEKVVIFLKRGIIILSVIVVSTLLVMGFRLSARLFPIKNILVLGNYHLEDSDVISALNIRPGESLLRISIDELEARLKHVGWIKRVSFRKHFPATLMVNVVEATPRALLRLNQHMFLIDTGGNVLEEMEGESTPFIPIIVDIDPVKDKGNMLEALKLINALYENPDTVGTGKESAEITLKPYGLELKKEGDLIKIGYGDYSKKLNKWKEIETEVRKKNITIDYVDLRFNDKVIVKPLKKEGKERR